MRTLLVLLALAPLASLAATDADYDPRGRRDPFQPPVAPAPVVSKIALERVELSELAVEAIVSGIADAKATVVVRGGESFVVGVGSRVGKWGGRVARITQSEIVIREEFTDPSGVFHVVERSLSIPEPTPL